MDCKVQEQDTYMNIQVVDEFAILDDPELGLLLHLLSKVTRHICFWHFLNGPQNWLQHKHKE